MQTEEHKRITDAIEQVGFILQIARLVEYPNHNLDRAKFHLNKALDKLYHRKARIEWEGKASEDKPVVWSQTEPVCPHCNLDLGIRPHTRDSKGALVCPE
jgi:hypothetical protein